MPDPTRLERELCERHPERWVRHHLESFSPAYFEAFDVEDVARHLEMLRRLDDEHLVLARTWPDEEPGRWWIEVVGYDAFQFLSTLCHLLAVHGLSIVEGRVFTSKPPPGEPPATARRFPPRHFPAHPSRAARRKEKEPDRRPKIVDRFLVSREAEHPGASAPDWGAFVAELQTLAKLLREGQHDAVQHRLIGRLAAAIRLRRGEEPALEPLELSIDPEADPAATLVHVAARDGFGFLALTAGALALCGIMIVQAEIRTGDGRADDTLWVTDRGGRKIDEPSRLRALRLSIILIEHFSSRLHRASNPEAALVHFSRFATDIMRGPPGPRSSRPSTAPRCSMRW